MTTSIEWTQETWNPTTGCDKVSPGCGLPRPGSDDAETGRMGGCYALTMAARLKMMGQSKYQRDGHPETSGPGFGFTEHPDALDVPLHRRKPTSYFVNSMSDLFHPEATDLFIAEVWAVMGATPRHTYQILTKRPKSARHLLADEEGEFRYKVALSRQRHAPDSSIPPWPYPNVWLGTSIESDRYTFRADHLRATPAAVRFLSLEPLLGPMPSLDLTGIDWVITGGESGPGARPMHPDWVRDIRDRCVVAGVPFFFKQWGSYSPDGGAEAIIRGTRDQRVIVANDGTAYRPGDLDWPNGPRRGEAIRAGHDKGNLTLLYRLGKKVAGRELDGRTWDEMPERVVAP